MTGRNPLTHTHTQNVEFEYIFYIVNCFFVAISILCVKIKTFLFGESVLRHAYYCKLRHVHCVLPGSLLKNNEWGGRGPLGRLPNPPM